MQLLVRLRKNSSDKHTSPLEAQPINPPAPTDHKPSQKRRSTFPFFSHNKNASPHDSPTSSPKSAPSTLPADGTAPTTQPPGAQQTTAAATRPRALVRVPSVLYCPVLDINGKGYGNEENRRTTDL